jgi:type II secretory pathway predicted ATPase ExeA
MRPVHKGSPCRQSSVVDFLPGATNRVLLYESYESRHWTQVRARLQSVVDHRRVGLITGEVGSGKLTVIRTILGALNPNLYKLFYTHWTSGSVPDLLRSVARGLDLEAAHSRGDLVHQISEAIVGFDKTKKPHPILALDESQLLSHDALALLPLVLNFEMDSCRHLSLILIGRRLLRRAPCPCGHTSRCASVLRFTTISKGFHARNRTAILPIS